MTKREVDVNKMNFILAQSNTYELPVQFAAEWEELKEWAAAPKIETCHCAISEGLYDWIAKLEQPTAKTSIPDKPPARPSEVSSPSHYTSHPSGVECITITEHFSFNLGNAMKYVWRAGLKRTSPKVQDLQKAVWYIEREIERLGKGEKGTSW
jgi:hypothetical protein